ncbi:hypothetical protein [Bradyrhizobium sp. HKCCYLS2033]|uniref:hypothetical protein n=1 Tax=Bradyrhizobium TaxID=374 RepID=UPI003EBF47E7
MRLFYVGVLTGVLTFCGVMALQSNGVQISVPMIGVLGGVLSLLAKAIVDRFMAAPSP